MKMQLLSIAALLMGTQAWAIDTGNQANVEQLKQMIFSPEAGATATVTQTGKTADGAVCTLTVKATPYGISFDVAPAKAEGAGFRASVSSKVNGGYRVNNLDEGSIDVSQVEYYSNERGNGAIRERMSFTTENNPGTQNNVNTIRIYNLDDNMNTVGNTNTPDYSKSKPVDITCNF
jgi:hypothetical protein